MVWSAVTALVSVSIASAIDSHRLVHALVRDAGSLARQPHIGLVPLEEAEAGLVRRDENGAEKAKLVPLPTQLAGGLLSTSGHGGELDCAHPRPVALDEKARLAFVPGHSVDATSAASPSNRAFPYGSVGGRFVCDGHGAVDLARFTRCAGRGRGVSSPSVRERTVRVLETRIEPGHTTPVHTHRWPGVLYILRIADFVRRDGDGTVLVDTRNGGALPEPGAAAWSEALPPHTLENVGATEIHVIGVELKTG